MKFAARQKSSKYDKTVGEVQLVPNAGNDWFDTSLAGRLSSGGQYLPIRKNEERGVLFNPVSLSGGFTVLLIPFSHKDQIKGKQYSKAAGDQSAGFQSRGSIVETDGAFCVSGNSYRHEANVDLFDHRLLTVDRGAPAAFPGHTEENQFIQRTSGISGGKAAAVPDEGGTGVGASVDAVLIVVGHCVLEAVHRRCGQNILVSLHGFLLQHNGFQESHMPGVLRDGVVLRPSHILVIGKPVGDKIIVFPKYQSRSVCHKNSSRAFWCQFLQWNLQIPPNHRCNRKAIW